MKLLSISVITVLLTVGLLKTAKIQSQSDIKRINDSTNFYEVIKIDTVGKVFIIYAERYS